MKKGKMRPGYAFSSWLVPTLAKIFLGLRVKGLENVPIEGRIIIAANHISDLDPPIIGALIPRETYFAAKIELFKGLMGAYIRYHNAIPVRRGGSDKEAIKKLVGVLKQEKALLIFPEGTRAKDAEKGLPAKAGVGMIAALGKADIVPVRIQGSEQFPRNLFKRGGVTVTVGQRIPLESLSPEPPGAEPSGRDEAGAAAGSATPSKKERYQHMADEIMRRIRSLESA